MSEVAEAELIEAGSALQEGVMGEQLMSRAYSALPSLSENVVSSLMKSLISQRLSGTVSWEKNLTSSINRAIERIDEKISLQLSEILQHVKFKKLEGSWRGLHKLVNKSEVSKSLKIQVLNYSKEELVEQFENAPEVDRSHFFKIFYQEEFGTAGGEPFGVLLGDYTFGYGEQDVTLLRYMAEACSAAHAPFIAAAGPEMFDFKTFEQFAEGKPIAAGFESTVYASWNSFRKTSDSRYITLTLPSALTRLPYNVKNNPIKSFSFEELPLDSSGNGLPVNGIDSFTWSNGCYEFGLILTRAYYESGWCTAVRGTDNGGRVEALPNHNYLSDSGDLLQQCPVVVNLTDEREKELSDLGFLPMVHYKKKDFAVFLGAQTCHKPPEFESDHEATSNAAISARLPYLMAAGRIAHYLKVMGRDMIGSNMTPIEIQQSLSSWLNNYVNPSATGNRQRARYPLAEAKIVVEEQPGRPGSYAAVAYLKPWLQMESLTTSLRMVANIPG